MRPHLASLVEDFRAHADETAVVEHRGVRSYRTSYGALAETAGRFSAELARRNIAPGERVVLWGQNSAEWIGVFFGCMLRGVLAVPLDAAGDPAVAARVIADTNPKLIVGDPELLARLSDLETQNPGAEARLPGTVDDRGLKPAATPQLPLATILDSVPPEPLFTVDSSVTEQTPFQIVFTSGTTSEPRGIVHTHRNVLVTLAPIESEINKYRRFERPFHPLRFLHSLPLSHVFGQFMGLWIPAILAAEVHFAPQLDPSRITSLIQRERISVFIAVPRVLHLVRAHLLAQFPSLAAELEAAAKNPPTGKLGILKKWWRFRRVHRTLGWKFWAVISGGATLPADLEAFWNRLGYAVIQGYGMTETAALVTLNHPFLISPGTIGKPLPGRDVRITEEGEILVRGDMLSTATWQGGQMRQREGEWLATGDLAERGAEGDLKFLGRKGDVIVTGAGLNIHPADLEAALTSQVGIRSAAVVPCEFATGAEAVAVLLTSLDDAHLNAAVSAANRSLAEFQQVRRTLRWPEPQFPYTSTGKLLRRQITQWACATLSGSGAPSLRSKDGIAQDSLLALISSITSEPAPSAPDPNALRLSEDLHLDSLGRVQLQSALEQQFAVELDEDAVANAETVGDLRTLVEAEGQPALTARNGSLTSAAKAANIQSDASGTGEPVPLSKATVSGASPAHKASTADAHTYPRWPWTWPIRITRIAFIELIMRPLVWVLAAPRVSYTPEASRLSTKHYQLTTPHLIIANHITAYDAALVLYALPGRIRRHVAAAMSGEILLDLRRARNQPSRWLNPLAPAAYWLVTALFNAFPLPRARGFRRSFAHAGEAMDHGYSVLIFPEGTRSRTGHMGPFRSGIGLLAQESQVPIVPVALVGIYDYTAPKPTRRWWFHAGHIEIRVGAPIPPPAPDSDPAAIAAQLEQALRTLLEPGARL